MPFGREFLDTAQKPVIVKSVKSDFEAAEKLLREALVICFRENPNINPDNIDIYIQGSYALGTNIYFPSNLEIIVELKKTLKYDPDEFPHARYKLYGDYFVETSFDFNPSDFARELYTVLQELTQDKCKQTDKFIEIPMIMGLKHIVEVTPCFTFNYIEQGAQVLTDLFTKVNDEGGPRGEAKGYDDVNLGQFMEQHGMIAEPKIFRGVLLYDRAVGAHLVSFPKLHARNGRAKNMATNGNFLRVVRLFKTLAMVGFRESDFDKVRGYFIQCLLFNVPNLLYQGSVKEGEDMADIGPIFLKVLNYLLNCDLGDFACQNLVWRLFGSAAEFWDVAAAKKFIRDVRFLYETFPQARTELV